MSSNDSTINLDDSSVLSSTKNSSVLEVSQISDTSQSVIDISDDSSDTEGEDDLTVNSTSENVDSTSVRSENIDSSSDRIMVRDTSKDLSTAEIYSDDEMSSDHYVTSNQSMSRSRTNESLGKLPPDQVRTNESADQSSILSATQLLSDSNNSSQATKDESSIIGELSRELDSHPMKLSESVIEANGENRNSTIDDLSNELANKIRIINDLKQTENDNTKTNDSSIANESVDKVIEDTFKDKSIAKSFGENENNENETIHEAGENGSPHKRKVVKNEEDNMTLNSSTLTSGLPAKRQRVINPDLPETCQMLLSAKSGAQVYLVGTAHFSKESCDDVKKVIESVQPDIVMIELCKARTNLLQLDEQTILEEAQTLNLDKSLEIIKSQGTVQGVMYLLLLSMSAHLTKELGMAPGGEFRTAYQEANKVAGCILQLGDRPINITLKRAIASLSWWQKLRLAWNILTNKDPITKEDVENCKNKDLLQNMLAEMAGEFPALSSVFVEERDIFLTHSLQMAADAIPAHALGPDGRKLENFSPPTVVGVVGIGHMPGITKKWGTVTHDQVKEVIKVQPPSLLGRVLVLGVKSVFWGGCIYAAYRVVRGPAARMLIVR